MRDAILTILAVGLGMLVQILISNYRTVRNNPPVPVYRLEDVISWICQGDKDRTMHAIVHKVYGGKRHLHSNPTGKKALRAEYPKAGE